MSLELTFANVEPFLSPALTGSEQTLAEAWLPVLDLHLNARYGDLITDANKPAFYSAAADAIRNRLDRPGNVLQQSVGPASVRYNDRAALLRWFAADQLDELDMLCGIAGTRTIRTPAPDGIRYGNLSPGYYGGS